MHCKLVFNLTLIVIVLTIIVGMGKWIIPFVISIILAYCFHYPCKLISNKFKISSTFSAGLIVTLLVSVCIVCGLFLVPLVQNAIIILLSKLSWLINSTSSDSINDFFHQLLLKIGINKQIDIGINIQNYINDSIANIPSYLINFLQTGKYAVYCVIFAFMIPIITFYLLKDWSKFANYSLKLLNRMTTPDIVQLLIDINNKLADYIKGQLIVCIILALLYIIGLNLIGVKESLVCGLFSGIISIAPFFGPCIGLCTTLAMCIDDFVIQQYIFTIGLYILIPMIDSNFITPKLIGNRLGISPVWMLFSTCANTAIMGTPGIFLSVPLTVIFAVICKYLLREKKS